MAMLVFFIKKKDGFLWLVQNYRTLNAVMVKNQYPLPLISKLVSKLQDMQYFIKLNVYWEFNYICIKPGDKWKAAFYTNCGFSELLVIFFGKTSSLATFQTMMNDILQNLIADGIMIV